jgi:AbrB family looped-hinge helix DNA binding protein
MDSIEITLAERGQVVIPKAARDALGLKPGAKLQLRIEAGRLVIEKKTKLDLSRWAGKAATEKLTTHQVLAELRGRSVPWQGDDQTKVAKPSPTREKKRK